MSGVFSCARNRERLEGDPVWEHKRGKVWRLVEKLERENRVLRWQVKVLQRRLSQQ